MLTLNHKALSFDMRRCCQCGTCLAACRTGALSESLGPDGLWTIGWDEKSCTLCGKCVSVCPSSSLPSKAMHEDDWRGIETVLLAYSKDGAIRKKASSGGVARQLLSGALNKGQVEEAYSLGRSSHYPWAEGRLWNAPMDPASLPASVYMPVLVNRNLKLSKPLGSLLLIGTTCQLLGAERLLGRKAGKIIKIALLCKQQKTLQFTKCVARRLGVTFDPGSSPPVSFRGEGWPGKITIGSRSLDWEIAAALPYGKRLWRVPGCSFCPNPLGHNVDLTLADPWGIPNPDKIGKSLVFVWSETGKRLIEENLDLLGTESLSLEAAKSSIGWDKVKRRQKLVNYYLGENPTLRARISGRAERVQETVLCSVLDHFRLPNVVHKVLAHMPDLGDIA